ncbi:MAG: leucyl aminopeptidase [Gammaproteobacteria bacterium]|nr:leucyl aminopeptidase [Gammaproteobacteria bacterium]
MTNKVRILWGIIGLFAATLVSAKASVNTPTQVLFTEQAASADYLLLGVSANGETGAVGLAINQNSAQGLSYLIEASGFTGKAMSTKLIPAPQNSGFKQILLVGLGEPSQNSEVEWQEIGGNAIQKAISEFKTVPTFAAELSPDHAAQLAFGAKLGSYYFDKYKTDSEQQKLVASITFAVPSPAATKALFNKDWNSVANAIWHTRNISNEPANVIYPESFVTYWKQQLKGLKNVSIRVFDEDDMLDKNMGAIYGVGRGSARPPRMMIVEYMGANKKQAPVVLVGKGITFDTGGISLKNPPNMWNMKFDMSGAASVVGTLYALADRKAKVNVVAIAALAENMPGANAQRPGDVVTSMSGKTIQIRSTDAEGRLVLADGIYYGDITYNPSLLVDVATLTGSASRALGKDYAALFTRHNELAQKFIEVGIKTGDQVWQLPLNDNHFKAIKNDVADIMNSGPTAPGASAGAAFVGSFVREQTPWVHLDIAGVAWNDKATPIKASPGSTSFGIRLLNGYIKRYFEQ